MNFTSGTVLAPWEVSSGRHNKYQGASSCSHRHSLFTVPEPRGQGQDVADLFIVRHLFLTGYPQPSCMSVPSCTNMDREQALLSLTYKSPNLSMRPTLWLHLFLITFQSPLCKCHPFAFQPHYMVLEVTQLSPQHLNKTEDTSPIPMIKSGCLVERDLRKAILILFL